MDAAAQEEQIHFEKVVNSFRNYARFSLSANNRRRKDIYRLPLADQNLLSLVGGDAYKSKLDQVDKLILANADFLKLLIHDAPGMFEDANDEPSTSIGQGVEDEEQSAHLQPHSHPTTSGSQLHHTHASSPTSHSHSHHHSHQHGLSSPATISGPQINRPSEFDIDKIYSTLKQLVRDWSVEGKAERDLCYAPMIEALISHTSHIPEAERNNFRVLVPGAGLGRLAFDIAQLGFSCQGNEFSHYMLITSFFMLNKTTQVNEFTIYPYIHSFSNIDTKTSMLRPITIPDVLPASALGPNSRFSLVAGDFEEVYGSSDSDSDSRHTSDPDEPPAGPWNAVLTCFFIDTAQNIVNYLRIIHKILVPGGIWINLGPLLWHWENNTESKNLSIELDLDELKSLAQHIGFEISQERTIDTTYTNNSRGMLEYIYHASFFVATKVSSEVQPDE